MTDSIQDPFAELARAHREIEARVAELERAADDTRDESRRAQALEAIAGILGYFAGPAALHHADEAQLLFPQLRQLEGFTQMLGAFDFQHQMNDTAEAELRAAFRALAPGSPARLRELAHRFAELQRAHITAEERALFPLAARTLSADAILRIGQEMTVRRSPSG